MTDINSDIYERFIGSRATALAASNPGDSLQGIIPTELMDGAICYVKDINALYQYDKSSTDAALNLTVIVPNGIGALGRWKMLSAFGLKNYFSADVEASGAVGGTTGALTQNQWAALPSGDTFYQPTILVPSAVGEGFTVNATSGIITYVGPTRRYLATLTASIQCATALQVLEAGISVQGDFLGSTGDQLIAGRDTTNPTTGSEPIFLSAQRIFDFGTGITTVQGMVRNQSSAGAILVERYHLVLTPFQ